MHHTHPQLPGSSSSWWSPARSNSAVGWHPVLQPAFVASQPTWLCRSLRHEPQPQLFNGVEVSTAGHSLILSTPKFCRWSLINPRCGGECCRLGGWSSLPDGGDMGLPLVAESHLDISRPTPSHCLHQRMFHYRCSNQHSVPRVFSTH